MIRAVFLLGVAACAHGPAPREPRTSGTWLERRAAHRTRLSKLAPLVPSWPTQDAPEGARREVFRSGDLELWGWLAEPPETVPRPVPVLVYFHGGTALVRPELERCRPFLEAGLAVFAPTLRGRNGNPGHHELVYGEVDDAAAAVRWVSEQPAVDRERVYAFGHSMGGATVAMLSLRPDVPLRLGGSSGGIYGVETFRRWKASADADLVRFDVEDPDETQLRVLGRHAAELVHDHVAYVGTGERATRANAEAVRDRARGARGARFEVVVVPGDHMSALDPALAAFLERIRR